METKFAKFISLTLVILLIAMTLIGCGSMPETSSTGDEVENKPATEDEKPENGQETEEKLPPLEITFLTPVFENVPDMDNEWWTYFFEKTNTKWKIDWIPSNDYGTKFDMVLASGEMPDIVLGDSLTRPTLISAIKNGAFWDLTDVLGDFSKYPSLRENPTPGSWNYVKVDRRIWAVPRSRPQIDPGIKIRKDWLDNLNLSIPTSLDEFKEILITVANSDPDGNGEKDTIGMVGSGFFMNDGDATFMNAFGCFNLDRDEDGGLIHQNLTDGYIDYVAYFRDLYEGGAISKEFSVMKKTQAEELFESGRAFSYTRNIWRDYTFQENIRKVQPEAIVDTLPVMKGTGDNNTARLEPGVYGAFYMNGKMPEEKLLRIMDYFELTCSEEWLDMGYFGIEGVHYDLVDGQKTLNEKGSIEVGTSVQQPLPMMKNTWAKVICPQAPKAYNDAKLAQVQEYQEKGQVGKIQLLVSDTWTKEWPKVEEEFKANTIKAIVGQISIDDYRAYVEGLRNSDVFKKAFQEYSEAYDSMFGE